MSGILGLNLGNDESRWELITSAAGIMQPRGDEWGGLAAIKGGTIERAASKGKITPLLESERENFEDAKQIMIHVNQSPKNPQPAWIEETDIGPIALAFDGKITNKLDIRHTSPYLIGSEAGIIARLIGAASSPLEGIVSVYNTVKGPFCLVLMTREGVFAARDIIGIRPMVLGRFRGDSIGCGVASESVSLEHMGMELIRDVRPGEIVQIDPQGFRILKKMSEENSKLWDICGFEFGYWARWVSIIEDICVGEARNEAGRRLAENCPEVDIISSFPMSGSPAAEGLHQASGIQFQSVYDYNTEAGGRSFLPFDSEKRKRRAKNKLLPASWAIRGKKIVMVDDSIVEGNQTIARISKLKSAGAEEISMGVETPLIKYPCPFDITPRGALLAATHSIEEMEKILGLKKLWFNSVEDFADSIISVQSEKRRAENPVKVENLCLGCFTGDFPKY